MRILRTFVYLCLSGLLVLSGYLQGASAQEISDGYEVTPFGLATSTSLGYIGFYNSGNDEWGSLISEFAGIYENTVLNNDYIISTNQGGAITFWWSDGTAPVNSTGAIMSHAISCYPGRSGYSCSTQVNGSWTVSFTEHLFFAFHLTNQPSTWSQITNWNAVDFQTMVDIYNSGISDEAQAILDAINNQTLLIESQYDMESGENFGVDSIVPEVESKLGVLGFASDTLIQFVDLFNPDNVNGTSLTFPAFSIDVEGETYQVWNDYTYDLNTLYDEFEFLIDTVRAMLTLFVWIAVFNYLVKEYERFVNG